MTSLRHVTPLPRLPVVMGSNRNELDYHWPLGTVFLRFNARPASVCLFLRVPQPYMIQWPCGAFQNNISKLRPVIFTSLLS
jgi:hypothetical protein